MHFVSEERRSHPRTPFDGPVMIDTRRSWLKAQAIDVSAGGIRLKSDPPLRAGEEVEVYFELHTLAVETLARVVRTDGRIAGLAFEREAVDAGHPRQQTLRPSSGP
jgi:hypothetical protein